MTELTFRSDFSVELVQDNVSDESVVWAARVSTAGDRTLAQAQGSEISEKEKTGLINFLMRERHTSPFEHGQLTFFVQAPLFVFREFQRHRTWSYNEESGRYKQLEPVFYVPGPDRALVQVGKTGAYEFHEGTEEQYDLVRRQYQYQSEDAYDAYTLMLDAGIAKEVARGVLPLNIMSTMYATVNPLNLMKFLSLRTKDDAAAVKSYPQYEINVVADQIEALWAQKQPITHAAWVRYGRR